MISVIEISREFNLPSISTAMEDMLFVSRRTECDLRVQFMSTAPRRQSTDKEIIKVFEQK